LAGGGLATALYALSIGSVEGRGSWSVLTSAPVGLGSLVAFVVLERRKTNPLLQLELLRLKEPLFRATNIVSVLSLSSYSACSTSRRSSSKRKCTRVGRLGTHHLR
jgi:hypothetical protein